MTILQSPSGERSGPALSATDRRSGVAAGRVLAAGALGLVLAMALNAQQLLREAQQKPFGWERDTSVAVWEPIEDVSSAVGLHLPRLWADEALGRSKPDPGATIHEALQVPETATASGGVVVAETSDTAEIETEGTPDVASLSAPQLQGGSTADASVDPTVVSVAPSAEDAPAASVPATTIPWFPTPAEPLKLRVMGDSMVQFFGDTMVGLAEATGVIEAETENVLSSGLTRPDFYDWPERIIEVMVADGPDAVVLMFGGNDAQALVVDGQIARPFSETWVQEYSTRVGHVMNLVATDPQRVLIWVGQPIMRDPNYDDKMHQLNAIYAAEAAERPQVHYVDIRDLFRGPDGGFSRYVIGQDGQRTDVRLTDGVHLSTIGGRWLSEVLLDELGLFVDLDSGAPS
ncbi:DUF459 domain-containing protein [Candidatus Poriferisodalis sp.]|uniref:SGNH/GDSL hydrolase family protein n=1 Tax=Candidatus Poriferisodalis sp. TaxID=3101277 RepID=UPI003B01ECFE